MNASDAGTRVRRARVTVVAPHELTPSYGFLDLADAFSGVTVFSIISQTGVHGQQ
jgi:hypothetical protein